MNRFHSIRVRWGYAELIEAINNPKRDRHAELSDWIEDGFDPNVADADGLPEGVAAIAKRWSRKPAVKRARRA